jgi:hypothetical protein
MAREFEERRREKGLMLPESSADLYQRMGYLWPLPASMYQEDQCNNTWM